MVVRISLLSFFSLLLLPVVSLPAATGSSESPAPPRGDVQHLIETQIKSWETGDESAFLATLREDAVFAYPGKRLTRDGALTVFRQWKRDFRDTAVRIHREVIDGPHFAIEYLFATTHRGTGTRSAVGTLTIGEVRDGKIVVWKEYLDGRISRAQAKDELPVQEGVIPFPWPDTPESHQP